MSALLVESLLSSDIFSLLLLVGGQSSVVGELSSVSRSVSIMSVVTGGKALPSDSCSLVSVVVLWCVALIPYHASCFLVGRLLSSESYSLVSGLFFRMVPAGGWSAGSGGKRAALWCMGRCSPFVSAVVGREASGVGE